MSIIYKLKIIMYTHTLFYHINLFNGNLPTLRLPVCNYCTLFDIIYYYYVVGTPVAKF